MLGLALFVLLEPTVAAPARDCRGIVSNVERLACFDEAAGTPARVPTIGRGWSAPELDAPSVARVMANEARRAPDNLAFILGAEDDKRTGRRQVVISAPAIATSEPRPYLAVSCVQNISRLQLLAAEPVLGSRVTLQLRTEHRSTPSLAWQVLENGQVLDAGRGLPAIEQIKVLQGAHRILVVSDHPALDGLRFDAQGLDLLIDQARTACRW